MKSERRLKERAKRKAAKERAMGAPGRRSSYARKISGDYPPNSPYRDRWENFTPLGAFR